METHLQIYLGQLNENFYEIFFKINSKYMCASLEINFNSLLPFSFCHFISMYLLYSMAHLHVPRPGKDHKTHRISYMQIPRTLDRWYEAPRKSSLLL